MSDQDDDIQINLAISADTSSITAAIAVIESSIVAIAEGSLTIGAELADDIRSFDWGRIGFDVAMLPASTQKVGTLTAHIGPGFLLSRLIGKLHPVRSDRLPQMEAAFREFLSSGGEF